ncbi:unnamed protein product [Camellia sinensis]
MKKNPGGLLCFSFMFTDFNHISYVGMTSTSTSTSTSNSNPDTLNLKNDQKQTESKVSSPPISEFPYGSQSTDSNLDNPDHENGKEEEKSEPPNLPADKLHSPKPNSPPHSILSLLSSYQSLLSLRINRSMAKSQSNPQSQPIS